jgi:hypothetical protein
MQTTPSSAPCPGERGARETSAMKSYHDAPPRRSSDCPPEVLRRETVQLLLACRTPCELAGAGLLGTMTEEDDVKIHLLAMRSW